MNSFPELEDFVNEYNQCLYNSQLKAFLTIEIDQQKDEILLLDELVEKIGTLKKESVKNEEEKKANWLLCLQLTAESIQNELLMLIALKEDRIDEAWEHLISSQNTIAASIRNHPFGGDYLMNFAYRLSLYEKLLFPKILFSSYGAIVKTTECSICHESYGSCDHIKGYAYMGKLCAEIIHEIHTLEEISIVETPANKRCRITSITKNGVKRDVFTNREVISKNTH